jgi:hypothetical protein
VEKSLRMSAAEINAKTSGRGGKRKLDYYLRPSC